MDTRLQLSNTTLSLWTHGYTTCSDMCRSHNCLSLNSPPPLHPDSLPSLSAFVLLSLYVCLPVFLCLSVCLCLSLCLFVCLSVCLFVSLSLSLSLFPPPTLSLPSPPSLNFPYFKSLSLGHKLKLQQPMLLSLKGLSFRQTLNLIWRREETDASSQKGQLLWRLLLYLIC